MINNDDDVATADITFQRDTFNPWWFEVRFVYERPIVNVIKSLIPSPYRRFDRTIMRWSVHESVAQHLGNALGSVGYHIIVKPNPPADQLRHCLEEEDF